MLADSVLSTTMTSFALLKRTDEILASNSARPVYFDSSRSRMFANLVISVTPPLNRDMIHWAFLSCGFNLYIVDRDVECSVMRPLSLLNLAVRNWNSQICPNPSRSWFSHAACLPHKNSSTSSLGRSDRTGKQNRRKKYKIYMT